MATVLFPPSGIMICAYFFEGSTNCSCIGLTGEEESSGFKVLILSIITLGLYELYWLYKVGERLSDFQTYQGEMVDSYRALVYLILGIFGLNIVARALIQNDLNKYAYDS